MVVTGRRLGRPADREVSIVDDVERATVAGLHRPERTTYSGRGLHGRLVESLGRRIVNGQLAPGQIIDLDRFASEEDVSRTVVREAVKVLVGKGLLDARPKYGTFVRERSDWSLLDPDVMGWRSAEPPDVHLLRELSEIRTIIEPVIARLAAERSSPEQAAALRGAFASISDTSETLEQHVESDLQFHWLLAQATGNELIQQLAGLLQPAQRSRDELAFEYLAHDHGFLDAHRAVVDGIEAGDPDAAEAAMRELVEAANADIDRILQGRSTKDER